MSALLMPYGSKRNIQLVAKVGGPKHRPLMPYGSAGYGELVAKVGDFKHRPLMPYGSAGYGELVVKAGIPKAGLRRPCGTDSNAEAQGLSTQRVAARRVVRLSARG